jgi:hypothetical protein
MTPAQFAELLAAIERLAPDPAITAWVAIGSAVGGVFVGFLLSIVQSGAAASRQRHDARAAEIGNLRQISVNQLGGHALNRVKTFQVARSQDAKKAEDSICRSFLSTGDPDDQAIWRQAGLFFDALTENLHAFVTNSTDTYGSSIGKWDRFTVIEQSHYELRVKNLRSAAQKWVNGRGSAREFEKTLSDEIEQLKRIRVKPETGA